MKNLHGPSFSNCSQFLMVYVLYLKGLEEYNHLHVTLTMPKHPLSSVACPKYKLIVDISTKRGAFFHNFIFTPLNIECENGPLMMG